MTSVWSPVQRKLLSGGWGSGLVLQVTSGISSTPIPSAWHGNPDLFSHGPPCKGLKTIRRITGVEGFHSQSNAVDIQVVAYVLFVFFWNSVQLFFYEKLWSFWNDNVSELETVNCTGGSMERNINSIMSLAFIFISPHDHICPFVKFLSRDFKK